MYLLSGCTVSPLLYFGCLMNPAVFCTLNIDRIFNFPVKTVLRELECLEV